MASQSGKTSSIRTCSAELNDCSGGSGTLLEERLYS
jgi:hypothetical protein